MSAVSNKGAGGAGTWESEQLGWNLPCLPTLWDQSLADPLPMPFLYLKKEIMSGSWES